MGRRKGGAPPVHNLGAPETRVQRAGHDPGLFVVSDGESSPEREVQLIDEEQEDVQLVSRMRLPLLQARGGMVLAVLHGSTGEPPAGSCVLLTRCIPAFRLLGLPLEEACRALHAHRHAKNVRHERVLRARYGRTALAGPVG
jgi:hypothetical protein